MVQAMPGIATAISRLHPLLAGSSTLRTQRLALPFAEIGLDDLPLVGGKNASLGELISQLTEAGVRVPGGFATTAEAFRDFLRASDLDVRIREALDALDADNVNELARVGAQIRQWVIEAPLPARLEADIRAAYATLSARCGEGVSFAVRSSATAEDLPDASFAGQQESYLNVAGIDNVLDRIRHVFASLYNDRAISYRVHKGFAHHEVALSAGVQQMVRSDLAASGVMFTMDTESGFPDVVLITASYVDGDVTRTARGIYDVLWSTHGRMLRGRALELTGLRLRQRGGDQAALDALWPRAQR